MFGSSDESDHSPRRSNRSLSHSYEASAKHEGVCRHNDADDSSRSHRSRSNTSDSGDRGAIVHVGTTNEEHDR